MYLNRMELEVKLLIFEPGSVVVFFVVIASAIWSDISCKIWSRVVHEPDAAAVWSETGLVCWYRTAASCLPALLMLQRMHIISISSYELFIGKLWLCTESLFRLIFILPECNFLWIYTLISGTDWCCLARIGIVPGAKSRKCHLAYFILQPRKRLTYEWEWASTVNNFKLKINQTRMNADANKLLLPKQW